MFPIPKALTDSQHLSLLQGTQIRFKCFNSWDIHICRTQSFPRMRLLGKLKCGVHCLPSCKPKRETEMCL